MKQENLQVIDFEKKGNVIRLYLGSPDCTDYWGDDWDDSPYDCNAGIVYERFVIDTLDLAIPFDSLVIEPCNGVVNCGYSKEDMKVRRVPCLLIVPASVTEGKEWVGEDFQYWIGNAQAFRIYFGDDINKIKESLEPLVKPIPI